MTFLHRVTCCAMLLALALAPRAAVGQTLMNLSGGFASSRIEGGGVEDFAAMQSRSGLYVMITADIPLLGSTLAIAPGGAFLDRGFKWFQGELENSLKLTYLQAVAPLRVAFPVAGPVGVHLFAGPGIGIAFGCQFNQQDGPTERIIDCTNDEFGFKSMDVVALGGGGLSYAMPREGRLMLSGGLNTSLSSVSSLETGEDLKHRSWFITAGAAYPLGAR